MNPVADLELDEELLLKAIAMSLEEEEEEEEEGGKEEEEKAKEELCSAKGELLKTASRKQNNNLIKQNLSIFADDAGKAMSAKQSFPEDEEEMLRRAIAMSLEEEEKVERGMAN